MALWGYVQGLVVSALSLAGFAVGAFAGSRLAPLLLEQGSSSPYAPLFSLVGGADGRRRSPPIVFEAVGEGIRRRMCVPARADVVDGVGGAAAGRGARAWRWSGSRARSRCRRPARASSARTSSARRSCAELNEVLPPSGPDPERARARRPVPADPRARRPTCRRRRGASCATPTCEARARQRRARCSAPRAGSRSRARDGSRRRTWSSRTRTSWPARTTRRSSSTAATSWTRRPIVFDPHNDVAVLRVTGPRRAALSDSARGAGRRAGRDPRLSRERALPGGAGRLGQTRTVISQDAYGNGPVARRMTSLRGEDPLGELGRAGRRRRTGAWSRRCSPPRRADPAGGSACRPGIVRVRARARRRARGHGALRALSRRRGRLSCRARNPADGPRPVPARSRLARRRSARAARSAADRDARRSCRSSPTGPPSLP